jgi:hypothetical protein
MKFTALLSIIAATTVSAQQLTPFVFSLSDFRPMQAPAGNPSSVLKVLNPSGDSTTDFASFDFFGDYPKVEYAFTTGNCCIRGEQEQIKKCSVAGACCAICQASAVDFQSSDGRVNYIAFMDGFRSMQTPVGNPSAALKPLQKPDGALFTQFNNFDYYGNLAKQDGLLETGNCCIRGGEEQTSVCGVDGACCAICKVGSRSVN